MRPGPLPAVSPSAELEDLLRLVLDDERYLRRLDDLSRRRQEIQQRERRLADRERALAEREARLDGINSAL